MKQYTLNETRWLIKNYPQRGQKYCADYLNRTCPSIRTKTARLGLFLDITSDFFKEFQKRAAQSKIGKRYSEEQKDKLFRGKNNHFYSKHHSQKTKIKLSKKRKLFYRTHPHPRGMLGKTHTEKVRKILSQAFKARWKDKNSYFNSQKYRQLCSDNASKMMIERIKSKGTFYSRCNNGWYRVGRRKFYFRSSWEVNYACYLEWLKKRKEIKNWDYEVDTFWFGRIKRGVRSYCPDFKVENNDGSFEYHEVKGWMDNKSRTKLSRMKKYYPNIKLILIDKNSYKSVKQYETLYPKAKRLVR